MKVCVEMSCYMEINEPILEQLNTIHQNKDLGTSEQYEEAVAAVEKATGFKFLNIIKDGFEHSEFRITGVYDTNDFEAIVEA